MRRLVWNHVVGLLLTGILPTTTQGEDANIYYALFFDGSRLSAPAVSTDIWWSDQAMLEGRRVFDLRNPVRVLQNITAGASLKGPRVVMANGDVLPGRVVGYLAASDADDLPARLLISLYGSLVSPDPRGVAVRADRVLGISLVADETIARPGSLLLTNGARLNVTATRWTPQGLKALTDHGLTDFAFDSVCELCIPRPDVMRAVLDDAFYPPLGTAAVIGRVETIQGAVMTYHRDMILVGSSKVSTLSRYLLVQPSWSSSMILVPLDSIWRQSLRAASEVPLSLLPAKTLRESIGIHRWPWKANDNVQCSTLASGSIMVDLGIGTHSCCEIAFDLPARAREFTALVGLDRRVGAGACAVCKIDSDQAAGKSLSSNIVLRSGQEPTLVGPLRIGGCRTLILSTQWAGDAQRTADYPLDIGSNVDWLMPLVHIDGDEAALCESLRRFVPGWTRWELAPADARRLNLVPYWDNAHDRWLPAVHISDSQPVVIHRRLSVVSAANNLVELLFASPKNAALPRFELHVDGAIVTPIAGNRDRNDGVKPESLLVQAAKEKPMAANKRVRQPTGNGNPAESAQSYESGRIRWNLEKWHGQSIQLALTFSLDKQENSLIWHALSIKSAAGNSLP
jgi:hypothetical protein